MMREASCQFCREAITVDTGRTVYCVLHRPKGYPPHGQIWLHPYCAVSMVGVLTLRGANWYHDPTRSFRPHRKDLREYGTRDPAADLWSNV